MPEEPGVCCPVPAPRRRGAVSHIVLVGRGRAWREVNAAAVGTAQPADGRREHAERGIGAQQGLRNAAAFHRTGHVQVTSLSVVAHAAVEWCARASASHSDRPQAVRPSCTVLHMGPQGFRSSVDAPFGGAFLKEVFNPLVVPVVRRSVAAAPPSVNCKAARNAGALSPKRYLTNLC